MSSQQYICFPFYACSCPPGMRVSFSTARRHQREAQDRLRLEQGNPLIYLPMPCPVKPLENESPVQAPPSPEPSDPDPSNGIEEFNIGNVNQHNNVTSVGSDIIADGFEDPLVSAIDEFSPQRVSRGGSDVSSPEKGSGWDQGVEEDSLEEDINPIHSSPEVRESNFGSEEINSTPNSSSTNQELTSDNLNHRRLNGWYDEELKTVMASNAWNLGFYFRHAVTLDAMDDLLKREKGIDAEHFKTIRNRIINLSGIRLSTFQYCSKFHEILSYDESTGIVSGCSHMECTASPAPVKELRYIGLWERVLVKLQCPDQGPEIVSHIRDSYKRQLESGFDEYEDFYSGTCFREYSVYLEQFPGCSNNISQCSLPVVHLFFFLSTDGAPAFKSATKSFWPVVLFFGNIPPYKRYQNRNLFPVLCIPGNPANLESFLEPLFAELEHLNEGVECTLWDGRCAIVKCHLMYALADLQAMKKICCIKGVNGISPCRFCQIEGVRAGPRQPLYYPDHVKVRKRYRSGRTQFVNQKLWSSEHLPLRNEAELKQLFQQLDELLLCHRNDELENLRKSTGIIREPEICRRFSSIRPFVSMPIDLMHLLFENVAPLIVRIWLGILDTNGEHAYLKSPTVCRKVDAILESAGSGIVDSIRRPRGLKLQGLWKAEEWRTFVLVTSLVALQSFLPHPILKGWWLFCQLCELSMRPYLDEDDLEQLSMLCISFFEHYSKTYYGGRRERNHLMRYVVHLILHIPMSTTQCGPLVCLSQFATERFIGVTKASNMARHKYAESVSIKWCFQHALMMAETMSGVTIPLQEPRRDICIFDRRSKASNHGSYRGHWLRGPYALSDISRLDHQFSIRVRSRLARFYEVDLRISRESSLQFLENNSTIACWARLVVQREDELVPRKYGREDARQRERSNAYIAAEFRYEDDQANTTRVYFGKVITFIEHTFEHSESANEDTRVLALVSWATRGLRVGPQRQIYSVGGIKSPIFQTTTVEDVRCIARNVSVFEAKNHSITSRTALHTFFVDERLEIDHLLSNRCREGEGNKKLYGID